MIKKDQSKDQTKINVMLVCPSCGKTVNINRKYCICHTSLSRAKVITSESPPEIGLCNFEAADLNCCDCPKDCMYCASFGIPQTNKYGFGGKDCKHSSETDRCYCCLAQVKLAINLGAVSFSELIKGLVKRERGKDVYSNLAGYIHDEMVKPVLARINREREKAG